MTIQNIHTARANARRHPWGQAVVDGWRRDVAHALEQDRPFFERMIPTLTPWPEYGQNCPVCVGRLSAMGETGLYAWDIRDPERLVCKYCDTEYPNADYPETGAITAPQMGQTFTYYLNDDERAHPEDTTGTHAYRWVTFPVHTSWTGVLRSRQAIPGRDDHHRLCGPSPRRRGQLGCAIQWLLGRRALRLQRRRCQYPAADGAGLRADPRCRGRMRTGDCLRRDGPPHPRRSHPGRLRRYGVLERDQQQMRTRPGAECYRRPPIRPAA